MEIFVEKNERFGKPNRITSYFYIVNYRLITYSISTICSQNSKGEKAKYGKPRNRKWRLRSIGKKSENRCRCVYKKAANSRNRRCLWLLVIRFRRPFLRPRFFASWNRCETTPRDSRFDHARLASGRSYRTIVAETLGSFHLRFPIVAHGTRSHCAKRRLEKPVFHVVFIASVPWLCVYLHSSVLYIFSYGRLNKFRVFDEHL